MKANEVLHSIVASDCVGDMTSTAYRKKCTRVANSKKNGKQRDRESNRRKDKHKTDENDTIDDE